MSAATHAEPTLAAQLSAATTAAANAAATQRLETGCDQCQAQGQRWCPRHGHYYNDDAEHTAAHLPQAAADETKLAPSQELSSSRDFVAGCAAGIFSTFVGHPFDTIKVRLQMGTAGAAVTGPVSCALWTVRREGAGGLFKGLASPMLTVPLVNAVVFGVYGHAKSTLQARHPDRPLSSAETCAAGAWAGLVNTAVVTPVELLKCRLQVAGEQPTGARAELRALRSEMSRVMAEDGLKGLWRGNVACAAREVCSYIGMFGTYEFLKHTLGEQENQNTSALYTVLSGSVAGVACWTLSYPQDVVKSHVQLRGGSLTAGASITRSLFAREGARGFWRGYSAAATRAIPANGAGFLAYECVRSAYQRMDEEELAAAPR
jgi:solute carrier family 25 carnitine/acylcarnitine transporter 20/29